MQTLGNFATTDGAQAFVFVAVLFDAATRTPSFALIQESPTDVPTVIWNGTSVETRGLLDDCVVTCQRPNDGGGVIRRNCKMSIQTEHTAGYPFFKTFLTKALYYGGQATTGVYFGLYAIDRQFMYSDLTTGLFLGYYQIDVGLDWVELAGKTDIPLVEVLLNDTTIVGATDEDIPSYLFMFNPWFQGQVVPKTFGYVPRVKMLNNFPTMSLKKLAGSISGTLKSNYTSTSTSIVLETNVDKFSSLYQITILGASDGDARIKMPDGEVIFGKLVYDDITNSISLNVITRSTYYAKVSGYTYAADGETPKDWGYNGVDMLQKHPATWSTNASVLLNSAKDVVLDPNGWMQANVQYFVSGAGTGTWPFEVSNAQLQGWDDSDNGRIKHTYFNNAAHDNQSLLSFRFSEGPYSSEPGVPTPSYSWPGAAFMYFAGTNIDVSLFFINPATTAGSGSIGQPWSLVGFELASETFKSYLRNGFSRFDIDHVYAEGDGTLIKIPTSHITSISQDITVLGLEHMCEVVFDMAPIDMGIGATSNVVYTDAMFRTGTNENRTERIIYEILKESPLLQYFAGDNINGANYSLSNWLVYIGVVVDGSYSVSSLIDKICFQIGGTFKWLGKTFWLRSAAQMYGIYERFQYFVGDTNYYRKLICQYTDKYEMLENSGHLSFGKLQTAVNGIYEYIPCYFDASFGGWQDPFYKVNTKILNRAIKPNERKISYKFDLINDINSATNALSRFLTIGHPSGVAQVQRIIETDMIMKGCRWEPMDPLHIRDYPLISTSDESNAVIDRSGALYYLDTNANLQYLMGALASVEQMEYQFNVLNPVVKFQAKMSQPFVQASGGGTGNGPGGDPGTPTPPPDPGTDPTTPPGGGSGSTGGTGPGGALDPMSLIVAGGADIQIDSTLSKTCHYSVSAGDSSGTGPIAWTATIVDPLSSGGASLSPNGGSFAASTGTGWVSPIIDVTLTVDYHWLVGGRTSRELEIIWTAYGANADGTPSVTTQTTSITVTLVGPLDIEES